MSGSAGSGTGAEVGVKKIDENGNITERRGTAKRDWPKYFAYLVFVLAGLGVWKVVDLLLLLV